MKRRDHFRRKFFIAILLMGWMLFPQKASPQAPTEYEVKAAFIYHFAKFVEWPAEMWVDGSPFVIGILGHDPFGPLLDQVILGKTVQGKKITVKRLSRAEEIGNFHILFISGSKRQNIGKILRQLGRSPVLTVSDLDRFAGQGGMVQLLVDQNRVRFAVNVGAFERAGLKPSSQLLKLAKIVPDGGFNRKWPSDEFFSQGSDRSPVRVRYRAPAFGRARF